MTTVAVAMDQAIAQADRVREGYKEALIKEQEAIDLREAYLNGERGDHPFSEPDLRAEVVQGYRNIALIRTEMSKHAESVNELRKKLDEAIREPVEMVIHLTRKNGVMTCAPPVQQGNADSDPTDT